MSLRPSFFSWRTWQILPQKIVVKVFILNISIPGLVLAIELIPISSSCYCYTLITAALATVSRGSYYRNVWNIYYKIKFIVPFDISHCINDRLHDNCLLSFFRLFAYHNKRSARIYWIPCNTFYVSSLVSCSWPLALAWLIAILEYHTLGRL